ncbi:MAG: ATP-binding cassette domain-containing protein [Candidatus Thiodiazotropha endolucinida]
MSIPKIELILEKFSVSTRTRTLIWPSTFALTFRHGLGISGPSGSGKTVFVRALLDLLPPEVRWRGTAFLSVSKDTDESIPTIALEKAVMIPQSPLSALPVSITIGALLKRVLRWSESDLPTDELEARVQCLTALVHLRFEDIASLQSIQLSGGMAQRVLIALALARGARVIVLDEPTYGLDPETSKGIERTLVSLRRQGTYMIVVSHDSEILSSTCDEQIVISNGRIMRV